MWIQKLSICVWVVNILVLYLKQRCRRLCFPQAIVGNTSLVMVLNLEVVEVIAVVVVDDVASGSVHFP